MMRAKAMAMLAAGGLSGLLLMDGDGLASDRPTLQPELPSAAGNWSRATGAGETPAPGGKKQQDGEGSSAKSDVPVPRPKPGSAAAKRAAEDAKKQAGKPDTDAAKQADGAVPKTKPKTEASEPVQAGLAPPAQGDTSAPYRGQLEKDEIKQVLTGKMLASRIDGKDAHITLGEEGKLSWTAGGLSGAGFWWAEKGRVCDRYDPSGDFPGRGAGCRSFEQKADGYYSGGRKLQFLN